MFNNLYSINYTYIKRLKCLSPNLNSMQTLYILTTVLHTNFLCLGELCQFWKWRTLTVSVPDYGSCHYRTYASATCYVLIMQHF